MAPTVVDSTCLIALERIGRLDILPALFPEIVAPPAVAEEFGSALAWMTVRAVSNEIFTASLRTQLHRGEAETIALAAEIMADRIVLDDKKARRIARQMGLRSIGTVGVILRARRDGIVPLCRPVLDALAREGFYMSDALFQEALRQAGETR
jgi:predicted nucleic acid-binding protein